MLDVPATAQRPASPPAHRKRMPRPDAVDRTKVRWAYVVPITLVHVLALAACIPWLFSWTGLAVMLLGIHVFGQGINIGYHRLLSHRSFKTSRAVERGFVLLALCNMQDTPVKWVTTHRRHHQFADAQDDPHSPRVSVWWSHVGWLFLENPQTHGIDAYLQYARDVLEDPLYLRLEKSPLLWVWIYVLHAVLFFVAGLAIGGMWSGTAAGALQFGLSLFVWGVLVRTVAVWHITWSVNSLSHVFGYRNYDTRDDSFNNPLVALATVGEGWHNNHHHDPSSASNQHRWWEVDVSYYEIKVLERLRMAWDVHPPRRKPRSAVS